MNIIPFYKPSITQAEIDEVVDTLKSGWLTTGPKTKLFEKEFGLYLQKSYAVAVNSCTAALHLALEAIGLKPDDTVVVPTMTFAATAEVVRYFGAKPLLVDCRTSDLNLDVADAEAKIQAAIDRGENVSAIMPVHYGGQIGDVEGVSRLARRYHLKVIEDAAHCCPAMFRSSATDDWQQVGAASDLSCFSFYANKTITTGEGGMLCTDNAAYAERARIMSLHGISKDAWKRFSNDGNWHYEIIAPGFKYNLTDIASSIGLHQLRRANELHAKRRQLAGEYSSRLTRFAEIILPQELPNRIHSWHLYPIRLRLDKLKIDRASFIAELRQRGVSTSVHWMPLHLHPYYRETFHYNADSCPIAARLYWELVTLPLYPDMSIEEVERVVKEIGAIIAANLVHNKPSARRMLR